MEIDLSRLSALDTPVRGVLRLRDDPDASLAADGLRFPEAFNVDAAVRLSRGQVVIAGHVSGALELECGRCLARMRQPVDLDFEARYCGADAVPRSPPSSSSSSSSAHATPPAVLTWGDDDEGGIQLVADDLDVSFLPPGTTVLSVEEVVREQVLLEVPLRPLCKPDCKGICPQCGADQNAGSCGCVRDEVKDLRLAGLADLKKRLEGGSGRGQKN